MLSVGCTAHGAKRYGEHNDNLHGQHTVAADVMENYETCAQNGILRLRQASILDGFREQAIVGTGIIGNDTEKD